MCFPPSLLHFGCPCPALGAAASLCSCQDLFQALGTESSWSSERGPSRKRASQMPPPLISLFFAGSYFSLFMTLAAVIKYAKSRNSQGCLELIQFGTKASKGQNFLPDGHAENAPFQSRTATKRCRKSQQASPRTEQPLLWIKNS